MTAKLRADRADRLIDRANNACYLRLGRWTPIELATSEALEIARDEAEGVRVAYVAATRARDLLVVPAVGDVAWDGGWTGPLNGAIYPSPHARRTATAPAGCPAFKKDSVWRRPDDDPSTPLTVCPGNHAFVGPDGPYSVVWWDPHALDLDVEPAVGIRRETLIMKDVPDSVVADGLREYEQWRDGREAAIAKGAMPSLSVQTATEWAGSDRPLDGAVDHVHGSVGAASQPGLFDEEAPAPVERPGSERDVAVVTARGRRRPGGLRFGELVHAVLAAAPLDADRPALEALAEVHGRILSAPGDEIAAGVETVEHVLAHELLGRARVAEARGMCRRETPVTCTLPDGMLVEGVVDLAFEDGGAWIVVDYKTDREIASGGEAQYRRQVALYVSAVAQATGAPCQGVLLVI